MGTVFTPAQLAALGDAALAESRRLREAQTNGHAPSDSAAEEATTKSAVPPPQAAAIATKFVNAGGHVIFLQRGTKRCTVPGWEQKATNNLEAALAWAGQDPYANVGIVGKQDGLWGLDDDAGLLTEYEAQYGPIQTYGTRTVSGGRHFIFRQNEASWAMDNVSIQDEQKRELLSARVNNRYVVAAGSWAYPHNDTTQPLKQYVAADPNAPFMEAPASLLEFIKAKEAEWKAKVHVGKTSQPQQQSEVGEGGRNNYLAQRAGALRNIGASYETILLDLTEHNERNCKPPLDESEVQSIAKSYSKYEEGKPTNLVFNQQSDTEVREVEEPEEQEDSHLILPASALTSTVFGDLFDQVFVPNDWCLELAFPALATAGSVLVPQEKKEGQLIEPPFTNLFTGLIGPLNIGKTKVAEWSARATGIYCDPRGGHYAQMKFGSAEQMWKHLHKFSLGGPGKTSAPYQGAVLLNIDEWSHLMSKAGIPDASFASSLTSAFYSRKTMVTLGGQGGGRDIVIPFPFSIIGGVVEEQFGDTYNAATVGGLYSRTLFGKAPEGFQWTFREFPHEHPFFQGKGRLDLKPVAVTINPDVHELAGGWKKADPTLDRIPELVIRIATGFASVDGRPILTAKDVEKMWGLVTYQKAIRSLHRPNPGTNPDAVYANVARTWIQTYARQWRTIKDLKDYTNYHRKQLGPKVCFHALQGLARDHEVEFWVSESDEKGILNPLPPDYTGKRPKLGQGLVRIARGE